MLLFIAKTYWAKGTDNNNREVFEGGCAMQFMIKALDGENKLARRMEVRPRHLEGMEKLRSHIICAGGLLDNEGKMKGSVLILDFPSRDDLDS